MPRPILFPKTSNLPVRAMIIVEIISRSKHLRRSNLRLRGYNYSSLINEHRGTPGEPLWQRNYYEHVVRHDESLDKIRQYILNNPIRWSTDPENPFCHRTK